VFAVFCLLVISSPQQARAEQWLYLDDGFESTTGWLGIKASYIKDNNDFANDIENSPSDVSATGRLVQRNSWQGFIYRPWVSNVMFNTILQADHNQYNLVDNANQSSIDGLFATVIDLYPHSDLPTEFSFEQRINKTISSEETDDNLMLNSQFTVSSRLTPEESTYYANATYFFNYSDQSIDETSFLHNALDFSFGDAFETADYTIVARFNDESIKELEREYGEEDLSLQFQHYWSPNVGDSVNVSANITRETYNESDNRFHGDEDNIVDIKQESPAFESESKRAQATLTSFIRSQADERLTYTVNGYVNKNILATGEQSQNYSNTVLSAGGFYDFSDTVQFSASIGSDHRLDSNSKAKIYSGYGSASYQDFNDISDTLSVSWFARDAVTVFRGDEDEERNIISFGYGAVKDYSLFNSFLSVSYDQRLDHESSSNKDELRIEQFKLTNDLAFNMSSSDGSGSSTVYLLLSDARHLNQDVRSYQHIYLSLQRNQMLGTDDNWGGNIVYEWSKNIDIFGEEVVSNSAFGNLWYRHNELWEVPNLRFTSMLDFPLDNLLPEQQQRDNRPASWQNDLDYRVGFLEVHLNSVVSKGSYYTGLEIKRNF